MKKIVIAAGTGFLGQVIINHFKDKVDEIVVLTRGKSEIKNNIKYVSWDAKNLSSWQTTLEGADALINLAGRSVDCRYTLTNKKEIYDSRIDSTNILNQAVLICKNPPKHWLNSSTSTIYRFSLDKQMTEVDGDIGNDFSMNIAKSWEAAFFETATPKTLKTALRTSIVLGKNGGAFVPIKTLAQMRFGGRQGNGKQLISWIHERDFARAIEFILAKKLAEKINIVSPNPVSNHDFMKTLRAVMKIPFGIKTPTFLLEIGSFFIRTESELVLKSRNVIPKILQDHGFEFKYISLEATFTNLLDK